MSSSCLSRDPLHLLMGRKLKASRDCLVGNFPQFSPIWPQLYQFCPFRDGEWDCSGHLQALNFSPPDRFIKNLNFQPGFSVSLKWGYGSGLWTWHSETFRNDRQRCCTMSWFPWDLQCKGSKNSTCAECHPIP